MESFHNPQAWKASAPKMAPRIDPLHSSRASHIEFAPTPWKQDFKTWASGRESALCHALIFRGGSGQPAASVRCTETLKTSGACCYLVPPWGVTRNIAQRSQPLSNRRFAEAA
jgi:hypothetical protein